MASKLHLDAFDNLWKVLINTIMRNTVKKPLFVILTAMLIVTFIVIIFTVIFILPSKISWIDAPLYQEAQQIISKVDKNGEEKITSYIAYDNIRTVSVRLSLIFGENNWRLIIYPKSINNNKIEALYIDTSKDILLFGNILKENQCPSFYLEVTFEQLEEGKILVTNTQTVGPCGKPFGQQ